MPPKLLNMSKVLFIVKGYCEGFNPNAICSEKIAECLEKNGVEVYFLSVEVKKPSVNNQYNQKISYILFQQKNNVLKNILLYPVNSLNLSKKIVQQAISIIDEKEIDVVVSFMRPYVAGEALKQIKSKRKKIKAVLFEIDSASNRFKYPKTLVEYLANKKSLIWETKIYKKADLIVNMKTHKQHYKNKIFHKYAERMEYVGVPCMQNIKSICDTSTLSTSEEKSFVYFGTFYKQMREPYIMLETLNAVSLKQKIRLSVYGSDKNKYFYEKKCFQQSYIDIEGNIDHNALINKLSEFDVLLSIGNKESDFLPSKTLECICSGKKVIHFYYSEDDPSLSYFSLYPNALLLSEQNPLEYNADKILDFLKEPVIQISYDKLEKEFYDTTPSYSAQMILSVLEK